MEGRRAGSQAQGVSACNRRPILTRDIFVAARDYSKISRASTDTTGSSLTLYEVEIEDILSSVSFDGGRQKLNPAKFPFTF